MKSLVFGIYGNRLSENDYVKNLSLFTLNGKRETISFKFKNAHFHFYKGSTGIKQIETDEHFLVISGEYYVKRELIIDHGLSDEQLLINFIDFISGSFTLCLYNKKSDKLIVSNDLFNVYPLFYRTSTTIKMFSNEYQPLIFNEDQKLSLSKKNIDYYFKYGFTLDGVTFFDEIKKTRASETIVLEDDRVNIVCNKLFTPVIFNSYEECLESLHRSLKNGVKRIFSWSKKPMVTITGGLDSRMILALTDESIRKKSDYSTFFLTPLDESNDKDVLIAKLICEKYSLNHSVINFEEKTTKLNFDYFNELRTDNIKIKITGLYGGEFLSSIMYDNILPSHANDFVNRMYSGKLLETIYTFKHKDLREEIKNTSKRLFFMNKITSSFCTSIYGGTEGAWMSPWLNQLRYFTPFLDTEFLKVWFSIPDEYLFNNRRSLYFDLYTNYFPEFKKTPTNSIAPKLVENNFLYFNSGIEPKKTKKNKLDFSFDDIIKMNGYNFVRDSFKTKTQLLNKNNQQRIIDFCYWYENYQQL